MRILHLIYDDLDNPWVGGGGAVRTHEINRRLAWRHQITVLTGNFPGAMERLERDGVLYIRTGIDSSYILSRITYCLNAPKYIRNGNFDLIVDDFSAHSPCFSLLYTTKPVILLLQNLFGIHAIRKHKLLGLFAYSAENLGLRMYKNVIVVSSAMKSSAKQKVGQHAKIQVVPNAASEHFFSLTPSEESYILFLGRLELYQKGLDILVDAFSKVVKRHSNIKLKIAGHGRKRDYEILKDLINEFELREKIELVGKVSGSKKDDLLLNCLFLCMPSRFESFGITAVEAAASQKPVIGTRIPGLSDTIKDNQTGLLIPPNDPSSLSEAIMYLIENSKIRWRLGQNARKFARNFTWDVSARRQEEFYLKVVQ